MTRLPPVSVADVVRRFAVPFLRQRKTSPAQRRVLTDIAACRTAALGGHVEQCGRCGERRIAYNSCRNRHCPSCLNHKSREWMNARADELLPAAYFHVVFTVPEQIAALALGNKKVLYDILFAASAQTLQTIARDDKHLGAEIGFLSVLHTWDQKLRHHPHVHCVVPGGGLSPDGSRWIPSRDRFFLPVRVLSRLYRGKFLARLTKAFHDGKLRFAGSTAHLRLEHNFRRFVAECRSKEWVVYAKPPFGSPRQVLKYLARYTHRVAISNARINAIDGNDVLFRYRKSAATNEHAFMRLAGIEFLRRLVQHVLPKGYTRIRHFGFLANCHKKKKLALCRELLAVQPPDESAAEHDDHHDDDRASHDVCPACGARAMMRVEIISPGPIAFCFALPDSS